MRLHLGLALTTLTIAGAVAPSTAQAAVANCMSPDGSCEISNVPEDMLLCNCADGSGGGLGGGNAWAGLSEMELQPICEAELAAFCGAVMPPPGLMCGTVNGDCTISNDPFDMIDCECADGSGFGYGGGNMWAGLSDAELVMVCEGVVDTECAGGPPPPPPTEVECTSRLGTCVVDNEPTDTVFCECTDGSDGGAAGGMEWSGLSPEELEMVCEEQILEFCGEEGGSTGGEGTTGGTGGTGDTGDTEGEGTAGEGTTTDHGETGMDDSGTGGGSGGGTSGGSTGGSGATEGGSEGSGGESGGDDGGGGGCSVAPRGASGGLALALLGLLGLGRRRRLA